MFKPDKHETVNGIGLLVPKSRDPHFPIIAVDGERVVIKGVILPHRLRAAA